MSVNLSRRQFLIQSSALGGGLMVGFAVPFDAEAAEGPVPEINAWVVVKPDDTVIIRIARSEMGQGTLTGLAQLVAEELECDWARVTTEYPTPGQNLARKRIWRDFSTGGSYGIRGSHDYVRRGGAAARMMLVQAAANEWRVPVAECTVSRGVISHAASGRKLAYGQVAAAAARLEAPKEPPLKDPKDWTLIGKPLKRLDTADKVTGKTVYGTDVKLPGMLNAAIRDCPVFGGTLKGFDARKALAMRGVKKVVKVGNSAVAVIADSWWRAKKALDAVVIEWEPGPHAKLSSATIARDLAEGLDARDVFVQNRQGDAAKAIAGAAKKLQSTYAYPYQNHAPMEPMNATARYTPQRCEVWCPTQNGEAALAAVAQAAELPAAQCEVYKTMIGGGFGRRGMADYVTQAVLIARQMPGTPIKLLWSREEDMLHGKYHPVMQARLTAGLDAQGNLAGLHIRLSGQSIMADALPQLLDKGKDAFVFQGYWAGGDQALQYTIPNLLVDHAMRNPPVPPGFWRGVNINQNAIFLECFIDELAEAAGQDALAFRRKLMGQHPKALAVLDAVAEKGGWGKPAAPGRHRGLAHFSAFGSYVAACAEISVTAGNKVKVHHIVAASDMGYAVNPAQIERQVAGSFVYGLSALFLQECTLRDGRMEQENFHQYDSMRIGQMPEVESLIMPSGGFWGGVGEPTICVAAPAVLNALYRATGKRIRDFPLKNHGFELV